VNHGGTLLALLDGTDGLLVDAETGKTANTLIGHQDGINDIQFSPDGTLVGTVANDGELIVWETATGRLLERWDTFDPWGVGFSPDNNLVYGGGEASMLRTWDLSGQDTYLQQTTQVEGSEVFTQAHLSPDGQQVAYRWRDDKAKGWVRFVDTGTGDTTPPTRLSAVPVGGEVWPQGAWHPQGGQFVGYSCAGFQCAAPGTVTVLDSATGQPLHDSRDIVDGDGDVFDLAYVDGGRSLLVGTTDGTNIIDAETLRPRGEPFDDVPAECCTTPIGDGSTAMVFKYSADNASTHWRVIDVSTGEIHPEGDVDIYPYTSVASPDGSTVAAAGKSGEIVTIDVSTGDQQRSTSLVAAVSWLNYSDDGELLVSGAQDGGVSLWDATTLDLLGTVYPPHQGDPVSAGAQFIGDTHDVAIASYDGKIYRWETNLDRALDFACQMAGRDLTEAEWEQFLPAQPYQSVCPDL
jgi:WD40 repeat protein